MNEQKAIVLIVGIVAIVAVTTMISQPSDNRITGEVVSSRNYVGYATSYGLVAAKAQCQREGPWNVFLDQGWTVPNEHQELIQDGIMREFLQGVSEAYNFGALVMAMEVKTPRTLKEYRSVNNFAFDEIKSATFVPLAEDTTYTFVDTPSGSTMCKHTLVQTVDETGRNRWIYLNYVA